MSWHFSVYPMSWHLRRKPQALCWRPLRGLSESRSLGELQWVGQSIKVADPGASPTHLLTQMVLTSLLGRLRQSLAFLLSPIAQRLLVLIGEFGRGMHRRVGR